MAVDKEFLVKNHFWILLFSAVGLALTGWLVLLVSVPAKVSAERDNVKNNWDTKKKHSDFKNPKFVDLARKEAEDRNKERVGIHETLYSNQAKEAALNTWPKTMVQRGYDFNYGKYAVEVVVKPADIKKADVKALAEDKPPVFVGQLTGEGDPGWFKVQGRDGKTVVKFLRSMTMKVTDEGTTKASTFEDVRRNVMNGRVVVVTYTLGKYFGEEMNDSEVHEFVEFYKTQLTDILAEAGPLNALDEPIVQFRYGGVGDGGKGSGGFMQKFGSPGSGFPEGKGPTVDPKGGGTEDQPNEDDFGPETWIYKKGKYPPPDNRFFSYIPKWDEKLAGISEEIWAAQENLWIQRELYKRIKVANDAVAQCTPAANNGNGKDQWATFSNFYWEIALKVEGENVKVKLKNLRPKQQRVDGMHFLVKFNPDPKAKEGKAPEQAPMQVFPPKDSSLDHDPLGPNETTKEMTVALPGVSLQGVFAVEQVLTWETAAVKRVEVVTVALSPVTGDPAVSHRQAWIPLKPYKEKPKEEPKASDTADGKDPMPSGAIKPKLGMGEFGGGSGQMAANLSKHGLVLDRYLEKTGELRKVPVNIVLIVDPDHIAKVEKAFVESPLRFLITQVLVQRCQVSLRPPDPNSKITEFGEPGSPGSQKFKGFDSISGQPPGTGAEQAQAGADEQENVELTIYGVITLYERPGRPAAAAPEQK